jgi:hypothetical protein
MDLCSSSKDPNGIPLNPHWRAQSGSPGSVPDVETLCDHFSPRPLHCTDWTYDIDAVRWWTFLGILHGIERLYHPHKLHGHVNWGAATYTGSLGFIDYESGCILRDHDYNLALKTNDKSGVSPGNENADLNGGIGLEFKASEVIDLFQEKTWWSTLKDAVHRESSRLGITTGHYPAAKRLFPPETQATVIGLMGIDAEHIQTELHPVWAMAINVEPSRWAIFARNWGGEGNLSARQHYLRVEKMCFFLEQSGVPEFHLYDRKGNVVTPRHVATATGVAIEIPLGKPEDHPLVYGGVTFRSK